MQSGKKRNPKNILSNLFLFAAAFAISLLLAEIVFRKKSGQPLTESLPFLNGVIDPKITEKAEWLSIQLAKEKNLDESIRSLYPANPPRRTYGVIRTEIEELNRHCSWHPFDQPFAGMKVWNKNFIRNFYCGNLRGELPAAMNGYSVIYTFQPFDTSQYPAYRYFPCSRNNLPNNFLRFNDYGWSGDSILFIKPDKTIRIAFLGASTTQQTDKCLFAYPDYIGTWLNEWAKSKGLDVKFEVINTGRVAQRSGDFLAVMKYELLPAEPDIVIYYEGRNQFNLYQTTCVCESKENTLYALLRNSALFREIVSATAMNVFECIEKNKKEITLKLPDMDISHPDIRSPYLPLNLPRILSDLDSIKKLNDEIGSTFVLCSFAMLTHDTLLRSGMKYASIYSYWMHAFGPVKLKDIELLNFFENRAFRSFCEESQTSFIDVAKNLTRLPEAFFDGIHLNCDGMKYHAWIVFTDLLPLIEEKINSGTLPKASNQQQLAHPFIQPEEIFERISLPYHCN